MLARLQRCDRVAIVLPLFVALVAALAVAARPATASNAAIVIPFEKTFAGTVSNYCSSGESANYYAGTIEGGSIEMWVCDPRFVGGVQHFTATLELTLGDRSLTAVLDGRFNFSTFRVVLNGRVTDGWLAGAQVHEESELVSFSPLTFAGTVQLMPASG